MENAVGKKNVVVIGTLDTKGEELLFLKQQIERRHCGVIVIDVSMGGEPLFEADVGPAEIARLGGKTIEEIRLSNDRDSVTQVMEKGAMEKVKQLYSAGEAGGIMAVGGSTMALFGAHVMKLLPFGIPKVIVCPGVIPAHVRRLCDTMDMTLMQGVVDFAGLNELVKSILVRAAGAMCGMVEDSGEAISSLLEKSVAITQLGWSDNCARLVKRHLEERGYRVYPFHAQGIGDRALDDLILRGFFDGVIDIVSAGVIEEIFAGTRAGGPKRLEAAGQRGLPQVIAPCSINITNAGIKGLKNLLSLNLYNNNTITDEGIQNFKNLQNLCLCHNEIITDEGIKGLRNLQSLDLNSNEIITNDGIKGLRNLQSLDLGANEIITNDGIKGLKNLLNLNLSYNENITDERIKGFKNLRNLNLRGNEIITDNGIKGLKNLCVLKIYHNKIITDYGIKGLKNLRGLYLGWNNNITYDGIKDLIKLKIIYVNGITTNREGFKNLKK